MAQNNKLDLKKSCHLVSYFIQYLMQIKLWLRFSNFIWGRCIRCFSPDRSLSVCDLFSALCLWLIILLEECEWALFSSLSECSVHPIRVMFVLFSDDHNHSFICAGPLLGRAACVLNARRIRRRHNCACSPPLSPTTNSTMSQSGTWHVLCAFSKDLSPPPPSFQTVLWCC